VLGAFACSAGLGKVSGIYPLEPEELLPLGLVTKKRSVPAPPMRYSFDSWNWDSVGKKWYGGTHIADRDWLWPANLNGKQVTASENHPTWRKRSRDRFGGDIGGEFRTEKLWVASQPNLVNLSANLYLSGNLNSKARYDGPCWAVNPGDAGLKIPVAPESSDALLNNLGTSAIADSKPTNSIADLATFLGELYREGVPRAIGASTWRNQTDVARKTAGDFLSVEFGYKPIVSDILDFAHAVLDFDTALKQYERDSGKVVRRMRELPTETGGSSSIFKAGVSPVLGSTHTAFDGDGPKLGRVTLTDVWSRRRWFSGAFTYHLPYAYQSRWNVGRLADKASVILGTDLTPELIWNLTPWSWAIDWVSNAGDVLSNVSSMMSDGLVLRYGYMMEHSFRTYTYSFDGPTWYRGGTVSPVPLIISHEVKKRVQATPFGFGLTWEGFTARQLAIITALGITRAK